MPTCFPHIDDQPDDLDAETARQLRSPGSFGHIIEYHESIGSTNDRARELALAGAPEGVVVAADFQSTGRGRLGRTWQAPPRSSLMLSVVLRPAADLVHWLSPAAALAVVGAIRPIAGDAVRCKWPNDVLLDGKKTCGILVETVFAGAELRAAVVGIGLNVNLDPASVGPTSTPATSLAAHTGRRQSRLHVLDRLLTALEAEVEALRQGYSPIPRWAGELVGLERRVSVRCGSRLETGTMVGVDDWGELILQRDDGSVVHLSAGEVTLAPG